MIQVVILPKHTLVCLKPTRRVILACLTAPEICHKLHEKEHERHSSLRVTKPVLARVNKFVWKRMLLGFHLFEKHSKIRF